jgi:hypothetical protein
MMGNPFALLGLLAITIPVIIHLLGRHQSRIERFPTLRFIGTSRLNPTRRKQLSDLLLLLLRVAIVAIAAVALTQPSCSSRGSDSSPTINRVVIVDTSASMRRLTAAGQVASVIASQVAESLSNNVVARVVETDDPTSSLQGAVAWLSTRTGLREIAVVSDFQRSTVDSIDLASIPSDMGLTLSPVATQPCVSANTPVIPNPARDLLLSNQKQIPPCPRDDSVSISTVVDSTEAARTDAAWRATGRPRPNDTTARIAIIYRSAIDASRLAAETAPVDSQWMVRTLASIQRDPVVVAASKRAQSAGTPGADTLLQNNAGRPVLSAGRRGQELLLFVHDDAGSLLSAALNASLTRSSSALEQDSTTLSAAEIAQWQRSPTLAADTPRERSDARWFWLAALVLIGVETLVRANYRRPVVRDGPIPERAL